MTRVGWAADGCLRHGCSRHGTQPKNNASFWRRKLEANRARDLVVSRTLRRSGWRVLRIWEHELRWAVRKSAKGKSTRHSGRGGEGEARLVGRLRRALRKG